jgi:ADP-ribosylglycohydrolase
MKRILSFVLSAGMLAFAAGKVEVPADRLQDQIRGGLLGHIVGDLNGLKHEMKYIAEPGSVESYVPALPDGAWTDDDTDVEWVYILDMQRSHTLLLPPQRIAELWKRHINRKIWCSHLYLRQLLDIGIEPPLTGSVHLNPWADFNLSAQFVSESWGLISPGMPQTAGRIGTHYTHVSVDGEPIQSTQLFTAMIATAFLTSDIDKILDAGVAAMDPASEMHRLVLDVRRWHKQNANDWRTTRRLLKEKYALYGGMDMRDRNGVKLNGGSTVAALLYGKGDWVETVRHAFNFGWDADNNAATSGAIVGVIKGYKWMSAQGWNIKDLFRNTSRDDMPDDETITKFGDRLIALTDMVISEHGGAKATVGGKIVYTIKTEDAANIERLADPRKQFASMQANLKPAIEAGIAHGTSSGPQARAAYLAICLDLAPELKQQYPDGWATAVNALAGYSKLMQVIFFASDIPAGQRIREKAVAAGVRAPVERTRFE